MKKRKCQDNDLLRKKTQPRGNNHQVRGKNPRLAKINILK